MNRRNFLQGTLGFVAVKDAFGETESMKFDIAPPNRLGLPIHQGFADEKSTILTVVRETKMGLRYRVTDPAGAPAALKVHTHSRPDNDHCVDLLMVDAIAPGIDYTLFVGTEGGESVDRRVFRALDINDPGVKVCILSCTRDSSHRRQARMWESLKGVAPDVIFCIGDAVYVEDSVADIIIPGESAPEKIWRRFVETRQALDFFRFERLITMMAIWDDHDFGFNGGNETYRHKLESKVCFETFFPKPEVSPEFDKGPGIAFRWDAFNTRFILLDGRFFRRDAEEGVMGTHWGTMQKGWLQAQLLSSPNPVWILNGCQFLGDWIFNDSVIRKHPEDLKWLFEKIRECKRPVTLFSGDVHYSEIVQLPAKQVGGRYYEITSSAMHTIPGVPLLNRSTKRVALANGNNFVVVRTVETSAARAVMDVRSYGDKQREFFKVQLIAEKMEPALKNADSSEVQI